MNVCFLALDRSDDTLALQRWLEQTGHPLTDVASADVVWYHASGSGFAPLEPAAHACGVLCTGTAAGLPATWGWDDVAPATAPALTLRNETGEHGRGHAFRLHALATGLPGGLVTDAAALSIAYHDGRWPRSARVVAVERVGHHIEANRATIWELERPGGGLALAVGAHLPLAAAEEWVRRSIERFLHNALDYLARGTAAADGHWPEPGPTTFVERTDLVPAHVPALKGGLSPAARTCQPLPGDEFARASRRVYAAAAQGRGVHAVWIHPLRVLHDFAALANDVGPAEATPILLKRNNGELEERFFLPADLPAAVWQWSAGAGCMLRVSWQVDLRLAAPFPDQLTNALEWQAGDRWLAVRSGVARTIALYCFDRPVRWQVSPAVEERALRIVAEFEIEEDGSATLAVLAGPDDVARADASARALDRTDNLVRSAQAKERRAWQTRVQVQDDGALGSAWNCWLQALDELQCAVPAGRSYLADLRPVGAGAPAYIDTAAAVRHSIAALGTGDFESARALLRFLAALQDPSGLVPHLTSVSGFACHDAAHSRDATLWHLLLAARLFAWTGDVAFLRGHWPHVRSALDALALLRPPANAGSSALVQSALRELTLAAEAIGERADADSLKTRTAEPSVGVNWFGPVSPCLEFMRGVLGLEPDAGRSRVLLRPVLPAETRSLDVHNIRVGETRFALRYSRAADSVSFSLLPTEGMVPLRVIFEPAIRAARITNVLVDTKEAALDVRRSGDRWICPLQVVLDHERIIVIGTE